jgi:hypothetical protein
MGELPDKCMPIGTLLHVSFKHILTSVTWFIITPNSTRILYSASFMVQKSNAYRILVGKPEGNRPLGRPRRRCFDSIKMGFRERGLYGMDWIDVAQIRDQWRALVNTVMNFRVP